ncbi:unnamed protein product, partial [Urochloa humidicola]
PPVRHLFPTRSSTEAGRAAGQRVKAAGGVNPAQLAWLSRPQTGWCGRLPRPAVHGRWLAASMRSGPQPKDVRQATRQPPLLAVWKE